MTLEEAREFYWQYGCSHFFMDREVDSVKRSAYDNLNISKEQELKWTEEYAIQFCDRIKESDEEKHNFGLYIAPYAILYSLENSEKLYEICEGVIDTIIYAIDNLNPYQRISLAEVICREHFKLFINIVAKADKALTNNESLINKLSENVHRLLDMQSGITPDFYDEKYRDRVLKQFELQLKDIKSVGIASEHKE